MKNIKKQSMVCSTIALCLCFLISIRLHSMNECALSKKFFTAFKKNLPHEVQEITWQLMLHDAIFFLGTQPIILKHNKRVNSIALEGDRVVTGTENKIKIWNMYTAELQKELLHTSNVYSVAVQKDIVVSGTEDGTVTVWNMKTGNVLYERKEHTHAIGSVAIDDDILVTGSVDCTAKIWGIRKGRVLHTLWHNGGFILAVSIQGENVITGSWFGTAKVWNRKTGILQHVLPHNGSAIYSVAIQEDILVTGSSDNTVKIWDNKTGEIRSELSHDEVVWSVVIQKNRIVSASGRSVKIWNLDGTPPTELQHTEQVHLIAMQNDYVGVSVGNQIIKIWSLALDEQGNAENNPLLWIREKTDMLQRHFIERAYRATEQKQDFIIALPKKLGKIRHNESQQQKDGRTFFTLPSMVRAYLLNRLNIRK